MLTAVMEILDRTVPVFTDFRLNIYVTFRNVIFGIKFLMPDLTYDSIVALFVSGQK